jgi:hypothetical protein
VAAEPVNKIARGPLVVMYAAAISVANAMRKRLASVTGTVSCEDRAAP